jgi:ATP-grasp domain
LLSSRRHRRPLAIEEFCRVAARFSALVATIGGELAEIDLNPVIVHADGCAIVDALLVPRTAESREPERLRQAR